MCTTQHLAVSSMDGPHLVLFTTQITTRHACREVFRARNELSNPSCPLSLSLSLFVTKYTQTDCFYRCDGRSEDTLPYSSRRLVRFRGQPKRWKETKSTSRFLGRTRWVNVCVFVCTNRVATRYKYASVFVRIVMYGFVVMYDEYT